MRKTKAAFKALREECGLSQQDVADEAGVATLSVKKWENPSYRQLPPDDVWQWVLACRDAMHEDAHKIAEQIMASLSEGDQDLRLNYYRTQDDLDAVQAGSGADEPVGYVNARMRLVGQLLDKAEVPYDYSYMQKPAMYDPAHFLKMRSNNTSGARGVFFNKGNKKWVASITYGGEVQHLGSFDEFEDAVEARRRAELEIIDSVGDEAKRKKAAAEIAAVEKNRERSRQAKTLYKGERDLTGIRFGKLVALRATEQRYHGQVVWECECDCGNRVMVPSSSLKRSTTRSCGCMREQDLAGKRFGKLTVLERTDETDVSRCYIWRCRCDCGKEVLVPTNSLTSGNTRSCGCSRE